MQKSIERSILLNPGPATTTDTVKYAQVVKDICPREKEFGDIMEYISIELTKFVANIQQYSTILFGGSGTAAVEAIISSVVGEDEVIFIINNGAYGERMVEIAKAYELNYIEYKSELFVKLDLKQIEKIIANNKNIKYISVVHNETTTGFLNDIYGLGNICLKYNVELIVDAMSSYGAIPIDMIDMNIAYLASSSNKNLQGMAGVSFVVAKNDSLENIKHKKTRNLYLNLYKQYEGFLKNFQMRFTPPVQTLYALKQAIEETKNETIEKRYERYSKSWETLVQGLDKLNFKCYIQGNIHSKIITVIQEPENKAYNFDDMHDYLLKRGFTIYPGKISALNTFRVANIGNIDYKDIESFLTVLKQYLESWK